MLAGVDRMMYAGSDTDTAIFQDPQTPGGIFTETGGECDKGREEGGGGHMRTTMCL